MAVLDQQVDLPTEELGESVDLPNPGIQTFNYGPLLSSWRPQCFQLTDNVPVDAGYGRLRAVDIERHRNQ
jgi:hypothetical protein